MASSYSGAGAGAGASSVGAGRSSSSGAGGAGGAAGAAPDVSLLELKEVLKATLHQRGVLDQLKARVRAEIFSTLDDKSTPKPELSNANLILNELIREYLEFNGYKHSLSVFMPDHLRLPNQSKQVPLLYSILTQLEGGGAAADSAGDGTQAAAGAGGAAGAAGAGSTSASGTGVTFSGDVKDGPAPFQLIR